LHQLIIAGEENYLKNRSYMAMWPYMIYFTHLHFNIVDSGWGDMNWWVSAFGCRIFACVRVRCFKIS